MLGDFNANIGRGKTYKNVAGMDRLHTPLNDNGWKVINMAEAKGLQISSIRFQRKDIHKQTLEIM